MRGNCGISTHSLTRRLTETLAKIETFLGNFNSQPHKEADATEFTDNLANAISTHSLTRRLTSTTPDETHADYISTHSLTRRLTGHGRRCVMYLIFQLTASQGGWLDDVNGNAFLIDFNSQPHKEADGDILDNMRRLEDFNSQPHKEADSPQHSTHFRVLHFNSQPHKEADASVGRVQGKHEYFNSQPHKEADMGWYLITHFS